MNTLVIGNGFDLAHKLPTQYKDFMNFFRFCEIIIKNNCKGVYDLTDFQSKRPTDWAKFSDKMQDYIAGIYADCDDIKEMIPDFICDYFLSETPNCWYEYYKAIMNQYQPLVNAGISIKGDNWVDFEKEISNVIARIELEPKIRVGYGYTTAGNHTYDLKEFMNCKNGDGLIKFMLHKKIGFHSHEKEFIEYLREQLDGFINMMDSYIVFISKMNIGERIKDFIDKDGANIKFSRIISFNYSKTFEEHYNDYLDMREHLPLDEMIEYAHGKAGNIKETYISNLVLGCEETLEEENVSKNTQCAYFKKYMQRDIKNTARKYAYFYNKKNKFSFKFKRRNNGNKNTAYIFGHTFDVNDGDIIKYVIENNDHIVIFYHTYDDIISKTQNLIKILGKEEYLKTKWKIENRAQLQ